MKVIRLAHSADIAGVLCVAGQVVQVADDYDLDDGDVVLARLESRAIERWNADLLSAARTAKEQRKVAKTKPGEPVKPTEPVEPVKPGKVE